MMENFNFDGVSIHEFMESLQCKFIITGTTGRGVMPVDNSTNRITGAHGARFIQNTFPPRTISVNFIIKLSSPSDLRRIEYEMTKALTKTQEKPLVFSDQEGIYHAVFDGLSLSRDDGFFQVGTIDFLCPDPFRHKGQVSSNGAIGANESFNVANNGNWQTDCIIDITTTAPSAFISVSVNGKTITYTPQNTIPTGSVISVNSESKEFRVAGVLRVLDVAGVFPSLRPGFNDIRVNVSCNIQVSFAEKDI